MAFDRGNKRQDLCLDRLLVAAGVLGRGPQNFEEVLDRSCACADGGLQELRVFFCQVGRVLALLKCRDLDVKSRGDGHMRGFQSAAHTRRVGIERQDQALGEAAKEREVLLGQRRAGKRDRKRQAALVGKHEVKLALDKQDAVGPAYRWPGLVEPIEDA